MREPALIQAGQGAGPPLRPVRFTVIVTIADLKAVLRAFTSLGGLGPATEAPVSQHREIA
jgi:hypothetical protein